VKFPPIRKFISAYTKISRRPDGNLRPSGFREISMRMPINFHAHADKFPCAWKFHAMRMKILPLPHRGEGGGWRAIRENYSVGERKSVEKRLPLPRRPTKPSPGHHPNPTMTLQEAQQQVDAWIRRYGVRYFSELTNLALLTEEVGELARVMARRYGDQSFKAGEADNLDEELADVLWVLLCIANQTGVDLTQAFDRTLEKKTRRDSTRHLNNPKL
jgi:NTP pyrophosphatase (non-canonical NTP hydrolase)